MLLYFIGNQQAAVNWEDEEGYKGGDSFGKRCEGM